MTNCKSWRKRRKSIKLLLLRTLSVIIGFQEQLESLEAKEYLWNQSLEFKTIDVASKFENKHVFFNVWSYWRSRGPIRKVAPLSDVIIPCIICVAWVDRSQSSPRYHQKKITHLTLQRNNYARDLLSRTSFLFVTLTAFGVYLLQRPEEITLLMFASLFEVNNKQVDVRERCQLISFSFMMRICWFEPDSSWLGTLNSSIQKGLFINYVIIFGGYPEPPSYP